MDGLDQLSTWLLDNDHQCAAGDATCWCIAQRNTQRQRSHPPETPQPNGAQASQPQQSEDTYCGFPHLQIEHVEQQRPGESYRKPNPRWRSQGRQPREPKRRDTGMPEVAVHLGPIERVTHPLTRKSQLPTPSPTSLGPLTFLSLPEEVRFSIYNYLFSRKAYHWYWHNRDLGQQYQSWVSFLHNFKYPTAILHTCKAISKEATTVMYSRLLVICDLRPDRSAGFNLQVRHPRPELHLITNLVLNLQLDVLHADQSYQFVDPCNVPHPQLQRLRSLKTLGLRVCVERNGWMARGQLWYNGLMKAHLINIMTALPAKVVIEGMDSWGPVFQANEMCCSMELELREPATLKRWVDAIIMDARRELSLTRGVEVYRPSGQLLRQTTCQGR